MLPNLIIIGAMKCGTTSLHFYLSLHPEIQMSKSKELDYFAERYNWHKGLAWYESHFLEHPEKRVYGESSPNYTNYSLSPEVPDRMHALVPNAKLIYLVRDPIERMQAQYIHKFSEGTETRNINEALFDIHTKPYLQRSLYYSQLERFLAFYPLSQILVVAAEDLKSNRQNTLRKIFEFLEVDASFYSQLYTVERHKSFGKRCKNELGEKIAGSIVGKSLEKLPSNSATRVFNDLFYFPFSQPIAKPAMSAELTNFLKDSLRDDINKLRSLTGQQFEDWSV